MAPLRQGAQRNAVVADARLGRVGREGGICVSQSAVSFFGAAAASVGPKREESEVRRRGEARACKYGTESCMTEWKTPESIGQGHAESAMRLRGEAGRRSVGRREGRVSKRGFTQRRSAEEAGEGFLRAAAAQFLGVLIRLH